jgi:hypothetical protein
MLCIKVPILPMQRGLYHTPVSVGEFLVISTIPIACEKEVETRRVEQTHYTHYTPYLLLPMALPRSRPTRNYHKELNIR